MHDYRPIWIWNDPSKFSISRSDNMIHKTNNFNLFGTSPVSILTFTFWICKVWEGRTALHLAVCNNRESAVKLLLEYSPATIKLKIHRVSTGEFCVVYY